MSIILYDTPAGVPGKALSPNVWKTRFCLNYKGLPYKTEWVEYCHIQEHSKKYNIKPTDKKADGTDFHSLPAIFDPTTGVYLADSFQIAAYLDKTYPDTPAIFPNKSIGLQAAFEAIFMMSIGPFLSLTLFDTWSVQNPISQDYLRKKFEDMCETQLENLVSDGEKRAEDWKKFEAALGQLEGFFVATDAIGPFILGDTISWGDIVVGSFMIYFKRLWGNDGDQWRKIAAWQNGRWASVLRGLDDYTATN